MSEFNQDEYIKEHGTDLPADEFALGYLDAESIDMRRFALLMLDWEAKKKDLARVEQEIKESVGVLKETQNVGNVRASYSQGRRELDYKSPGIEQLDADTIETYTEHVPQRIIEAYDEIDWRKACQAVGVEPVTVKEGTPSVTVKLVK